MMTMMELIEDDNYRKLMTPYCKTTDFVVRL